MDYQTGLSYEQVKDALSKLRSKQIIETRKTKFGNVTLTAIRLTERALVMLSGEGQMAPSGEGQMALPSECHMAPSYIQGVLTGSYNKEKIANAVPALADEDRLPLYYSENNAAMQFQTLDRCQAAQGLRLIFRRKHKANVIEFHFSPQVLSRPGHLTFVLDRAAPGLGGAASRLPV